MHTHRLPLPFLLSSAESHSPVQLPRSLDLAPRPLPSHWQAHSMSSPPVTSHIFQSQDIILQLFPCIALDGHGRELSCKSCNCLRIQIVESRAWMDREFCKNTARVLVAQSIEALQRFLERGLDTRFARREVCLEQGNADLNQLGINEGQS
jgi:hypothetical protein